MELFVIFLLVHKVFDRACYFGIASVLKNYFKYHLHYSAESAGKFQSLFSFLAFASTLLGGWLADTYIGKFNAVIFFGFLTSVAACGIPLGNLESLSFLWWPSIMLLAIGTGAMMPCATGYAGDQLKESSKQIEVFYSLWFFALNFGWVLPIIYSGVLMPSSFQDWTSENWTYCFIFPAAASIICVASVACFWCKGFRESPQKSALCSVIKILIYRRKKSESEITKEFGHEKYEMALSVKKAIPVFVCLTFYFITTFLCCTFYDDQHGYMQEIVKGFPRVISQTYTPIFSMLCTPIILLSIKLLRKRNVVITHQRKMLFGIFLGALNQTYVTFLHWLIFYLWKNEGRKLNAAIQFPVWILDAMSLNLIYGTSWDYIFSCAHPKLKSSMLAVLYFLVGIGSLICTGLFALFEVFLPVNEINHMPSNYNACYQGLVFFFVMISTFCAFYCYVDFTPLKNGGGTDPDLNDIEIQKVSKQTSFASIET